MKIENKGISDLDSEGGGDKNMLILKHLFSFDGVEKKIVTKKSLSWFQPLLCFLDIQVLFAMKWVAAATAMWSDTS